MKSIKVLIVDDIPENLLSYEAIFAEEDFTVIKALSGNEALSIILKHDFALILLDVQMPDMDGFETAELIRGKKKTRDIPIIFVTGIDRDQKFTFKGYESGAVDFLYKPINPIILKSKIRIFINLYEQKMQLTENAEQLFMLLNSLPNAAYTCKPDGNYDVTFASQSVLKLTGFSSKEFIENSKLWGNQIHPDDKKSVNKFSANSDGKDYYKDEYRWQMKNGHYKWFSDHFRFIRNPDGSIKHIIGVWSDITKRKNDEEEIRQYQYSLEEKIAERTSELSNTYQELVKENKIRKKAQETQKFLVSILEHTPDLVGYIDPKMNIEYINPAGMKMLGLKNMKDYKMKMDHVENIIPLVIKNGSWNGETTLQHADGHEIPVLLSSAVHKTIDGNISSFSAIARDISEFKNLEDQFRQSQKMEAIGRLAGGIAHDFNNLIMIIMGYSDILLKGVTQRSSYKISNEEAIKQVQGAAMRAADLTSQLLAYSRKQMLTLTIFDLKESILGLKKMLPRLIGEDINLETNLAQEKFMVKADKGQIDQVILNLAVNARDAMPKGGRILLEISRVLEAEELLLNHNFREKNIKGQFVELVVEDSGEGMTEIIQKQIFEPFFTTKEKGKGTGLGLSTVYGIIKQLDGHITVKSELEKGTKFLIYLPIYKGKVESQKLEVASQNTFGGATILLVEDEDDVFKLCKAILLNNGYKVLEGRTVKNALEICQNQSNEIHLLLSDIVMPNTNGSELAHIVHKNWPNIKILLMSGYTEHNYVRDATQESWINFLQKPFMPEKLLEKIKSLLP